MSASAAPFSLLSRLLASKVMMAKSDIEHGGECHVGGMRSKAFLNHLFCLSIFHRDLPGDTGDEGDDPE